MATTMNGQCLGHLYGTLYTSQCSATRRRRDRRMRQRTAVLAVSTQPCAPVRSAKVREAETGIDHGQCACEIPFPTDGLPLPSGFVRDLAENPQTSAAFIDQLEIDDPSRVASLISSVRPLALDLAFSPNGCRVVQKTLEVAGGTERDALVGLFHGHVLRLVDSHHGNHVLQKLFEVMPPASVAFALDELAFFPGGWLALARDKYGCRIMERVIEHCHEDTISGLMAEVMTDIRALCRHPYGNYIVQHVLEYGSVQHRRQVVQILVEEGVVDMAQQRMASHVVEKGLDHSGTEGRWLISNAILQEPFGLVTLACSRYGCFTAEKLIEVAPHALMPEVKRQLHAGAQQLKATKFGRSLLEKGGKGNGQ